jgi:hypothetical protein
MEAPSIRTPFLVAWLMAFASACTVRTQWPPSMRWLSSSQCGSPRMLPL